MNDRKELGELVRSHEYVEAVEAIRDILRRHLAEILGGGNWDTIRNQLGVYTIIARAKTSKRIIEKYDALKGQRRPIDSKCFYVEIPDLIGGRIVVLDPSDLFTVAQQIDRGLSRPIFTGASRALMRKHRRVRHGRLSMYDIRRFRREKYRIDVEANGYCSVHFVRRLGPAFFDTQCSHAEVQYVQSLHDTGRIPKDQWHVEVQVRTILEEAWGEVSHFVQYEEESLKDDAELSAHFAALSSYLQGANYHVSLIRKIAQRKLEV